METRTSGSYYPRAVSGPIDHVGARHTKLKVRPKVALGSNFNFFCTADVSNFLLN
jgi:hypothetical protein